MCKMLDIGTSFPTWLVGHKMVVTRPLDALRSHWLWQLTCINVAFLTGWGGRRWGCDDFWDLFTHVCHFSVVVSGDESDASTSAVGEAILDETCESQAGFPAAKSRPAKHHKRTATSAVGEMIYLLFSRDVVFGTCTCTCTCAYESYTASTVY